MRRLSSHITFTNASGRTLTITKVCDVNITETWRTLTNTATITIPRKVKWKNEFIHLGSSGLINEEDKVVIKLGYDNDLREEFTGYVKNVGAGFPVVIECEDGTYLLKKHRVQPKEFSNATLIDILKYILPSGTTYNAPDISLGKYIIREEVTAAQVLNHINGTYNLPVFFRGGILYAGLPYFPEYQVSKTFQFGFNIISSALKFIKEDDVKLRITAIGMMDDNTKVEVSEGDDTGELRTFYLYNVNDQSKLREFAKQRMKELKYTGLHGRITAFGIPVVSQGDVCKIVDNLEETKEREGQYLIERVIKKFGFNDGFRREIELGRKIA